MRMRRKKHRYERIEKCADIVVSNIDEYKNDIKAIFPDDKPLRVEIGCGKGRFITESAKLHPETNFLAVEKNLDVMVLAVEKAKREDIKNIRFVGGDANVFSEFETKSKCEVIYINFCDPWHKTSHAKRRLTHENYLKIWEKILQKNGEIYFKTDNKALFEFSLNSFAGYDMKLKNITLDLHSSNFADNVVTEYEELFSSKGNPIYRCEAEFR